MQTYISYVRENFDPILSFEAKKVLQDFFIVLRGVYRAPNNIPVTIRQLESMIRLSKARARLDCRNIVLREDAEDIVCLVKFSLFGDWCPAVSKCPNESLISITPRYI